MKTQSHISAVAAARGFSLVELMVTIAIALFLLGGLLTVVQNVRSTYASQQAMAQLQDQQRFAFSVLTDVIQAGSYFPDPTVWTPANSLPAVGPYQAGAAFTGASGPPDQLGVRYRTALNDGVIVCDGSTNLANPTHLYTNTFTVTLPAGNVPGTLNCSVDGANPIVLVQGVQSMQVWYGVKRNFATSDYNVDTYLTAAQMGAADWGNISSVRVQLIFTNPLVGFGMAGQQPPTITMERVVEVMGRAGVHT
ncbi:MAG: PilW family protein [Gammaproteobacteria bacterium]|nr:PilW family protein [Gammaproteobacteria bacterium]